MFKARLIGEAIILAVFIIGYCAWSVFGQTYVELLTPEQARMRREYDAILRAERTPLPQTAWIKQQIEKGVVTKIATKPANAQAIWVDAARLTKLTEFQRSTLIGDLADKMFPAVKKPLPVAVYDTKPGGKQGKKIGSYAKSAGLKLTIKFDEPPEFDNEADMFRLDPPAK